ncbi:MAG TPA: MFS transporter [Gammaproteobacteria bacterium]
MIGPHLLPCETPAAHAAERGLARSTRFVLPATILGSSLGFIDASVVNVALPAMERSLDASLGTLQWVMNGYLLTLASLILLGGSAGDRYGRRRVFVFGLIGFVLSSLACGLAPSATWLVAARIAQGAAAAFVTPTSLAIIGAAYHGSARGPAIGTWAAAGALTTALGPPLGGWLVDTLGWRSIFFINLPLGAVAIWLATKLPVDRDDTGTVPLDRRGALLAIAALGFACYGLIALGERRAVMGTVAVAAAVPLTWLFVLAETRSSAPMLPLALFADRTFTGANALTLLLYAALGGALFLLPFVLIQARGVSALAAGAAFLPFSLIMGLGSRWAGGLIEQFGARTPLIAGPALTAIGYALLGAFASHETYWVGVAPGLIVVAVGMTIAIPPLTTAVLDSVPDDKASTASGVNNAAARTGSLLAVAALGIAVSGTAAELGATELTAAYRLVMFIAAALAAASAATAAATIPAR